MSLPEVLLWSELRQQTEVKFRRQHPLGPYILDFYCPKAKVGIEIEGIAHDMGSRPEHDAMRVAWLAEQGVDVIRLPASEVLKSPKDVAEALVRHCRR
jgi:very-short-patch-repair endonuclease